MTTVATNNAAAGIVARKSPDLEPVTGKPTPIPPRRRQSKIVANGRLYLVLLALMAPTLGGMLLFTYYPQWSAIKYSFYRWDGAPQGTLEYIGWQNYIDILTSDNYFWPSFQLVGILLVANLFKMWPSILAAVTLHRIRSERWQYIYRVLFVIPMIIPALVGLLVWKMFFDSTQGALNKFLNATGLMSVLNWLDGVMPKAAAVLTPVRTAIVDTPFANVFGLCVVGALLLFARKNTREVGRAIVGWMLLGLAAAWAFQTPLAAMLGDFAKSLGGVAAIMAISIVGVITVSYALAAIRTKFPGGWHIWLGSAFIAIGVFFLLTTMIWVKPTHAFQFGAPAWLGDGRLIIPSIIFWGFPWIGTVGVLLYLAGLQNISQDVYEAGEIDGLNTFGKLWYLELPLILTQVRINLIFMTIATLTDYYLVFLLLGASGGPGGVGMVPGLYMYRTAFVDSRYGFSCALGMVLFVLILLITVVYQKYVKVDK